MGDENKLSKIPTLQQFAFRSLQCCHLPQVISESHLEVIKIQFDAWFAERLINANVQLSNKLSALLKEAAWTALVLADTPAEQEVFCRIGKYSQTPNQRYRLHIASQWLGLQSQTWFLGSNWLENKRIVRVRRRHVFGIARGNDPVFEMGIHFEKVGDKKERNKGGVRCDGCDVSSHSTPVCESVYHAGRYCDNCLEGGACETDPGNASKWEVVMY